MRTAPPVSPQAPQGNATAASPHFSLQADPEPNAPRFADLLQRGQAAHGTPAQSSQAGLKPQELIANDSAQEAGRTSDPVEGEPPEVQAALGAASKAALSTQLRRKGTDDEPDSPADASTEFIRSVQTDLDAAARPADLCATADAQSNAAAAATPMVDPGSLLPALMPALAVRAEAPADRPGDPRSAAPGIGRTLRALWPDAAPGVVAAPNTAAGTGVDPSNADGGEVAAAALAGTTAPERKVDPRITHPGERTATKADLPSAADHLPAVAEGLALGRPTPPRPDASASDGRPDTRSPTSEPGGRRSVPSDSEALVVRLLGQPTPPRPDASASDGRPDARSAASEAGGRFAAPSGRAALVVHLAATSAVPVAVERASARVEATSAVDAAPAALAGAGAAPLPRAFDAGSLPPIALATPLQSPDFAQALGAQVSVLARNGIETAELHLNPAEMGPVRVQIEIDGAKARVDFSADSSTTRQVIERGLPELAAALREQGLTLSGGGVFQHAPDRRDANAGDPNGSRGQSRRRTFTASVEAAPRRVAAPVAQGTVDLYA